MKFFRNILVFLTLLSIPAFAYNPADIPAVSTIAALRTISAAAASQYPNIVVQDYYGTGSGCPIQYSWSASSSATDNGGAVINPTGNSGNGRWLLNLSPNSPVHSCVFGIKVDSDPILGGGTDNSTQFAALMSWAHSSGPNWINIDSNPGKCIGFSTPMTLTEGLVITGDGSEEQQGVAKTGSCISYTATSGYVFSVQTPINAGLGNTPYEGPKFRDFTINYINQNTNVGGCVSINSAGGGFNNSSADQQSVTNVEVSHIRCNLGYIIGNKQLGFYCAKCFDGDFDSFDSYDGLTGIYLDGSDNISISGGCRITNTYGPMVRFKSENTYGNNDNISDCELLAFADPGGAQTIDSAIQDGARSSTISDVFVEGAAPTGGSLTYQIDLEAGLKATVRDNVLTAGTTSTPFIHIAASYQTVDVQGNTGLGSLIGTPSFGAIPYFYNSSGLQVTLEHSGNGQNGDFYWPFNSNPGNEQTLPNGSIQTWTPSTPGLQHSADGGVEIPYQNTFTFSGSTSGDYLDFRRYVGPTLTGTMNATVRAWTTSGTATLTCQITDNGTPTGGTQTASLTATPQYFSLSFATATTTDAGIRCYPSATTAVIQQINLTH